MTVYEIVSTMFHAGMFLIALLAYIRLDKRKK